MNVKITVPGPTGIGTKVFDDEGHEFHDITSLDIRIRPDEIVTAQTEFFVSGEMEIDANMSVTFEHLTELAAARGYKLVPIEET